MKLRVCTLFSGYDSQCMALDRLKEKYPEFDYELVAWAEIDKYAIQAHNAVYPQWGDRNYGDVSKINWDEVPDFDLLTYSSPCQDFSNAGKQAGGAEGSGTRSSLLWEVRRAIIAKKPKYLLMENVAALVSQKFIGTFNQWQLQLERYGYTNFSQVLNAKDYGVPQNRERIFMVSVLNCEQAFYFPEPIPLTKRLKDVLETEVDERYYLSQQAVDGFNRRTIRNAEKGNGFEREPTEGEGVVKEPIVYDDYNGKVREDQDTIGTITTNCGTKAPRNGFKIVEPLPCGCESSLAKIDVIGHKHKGMSGTIYGAHGIAPTITTNKGDGQLIGEPQVMTPKRTEYGKKVRKQYESHQLDEQRNNLQQLEPRTDGVSNTLTSVQKDNYVLEPVIGAQKDNIVVGPINTDKEGNAVTINAGYYKYGSKTILGGEYGTSGTAVMESEYRIRKLTERECLRLMGVSEEDIDKLIYHSGFTVWNGKKYVQVPRISKSRLYKLAGNSIVVDVMVGIFEQLLIGNKNTNQQLEIF